MESHSVNVERREDIGKIANKRLKSEGMVPGIVYSEGTGIPVALDESELRNLLSRQGDDVLLSFSLDGKKISARIKEVQREPVSQEIQHIDLMPLKEDILH